MSFANLKKNSKNGIMSLQDRLKNENQEKKDYNDDRYWAPAVDKSGNGFAVIRFLPAPGDEEMPYVKMYNHGFKVGAKWFIEHCPTTIGGKCFVCEQNNELWATELKENQAIVRNRKRQQSYHSNIIVVSDPKNPDNEGKVFLYRYGAKIFQKIIEAIQPEFDDETPMNPFDFWEGANFKLKIRQVEGYRNYDKSEFERPTPLFDGDEVMLEKVWKQEHSLTEIISPDKFKPYEELVKKFKMVVNNQQSSDSDDKPEVPKSNNMDRFTSKKEPKKSEEEPKEETSTPAASDDDDDDFKMYARLLEG